jgi:hypothetical protein
MQIPSFSNQRHRNSLEMPAHSSHAAHGLPPPACIHRALIPAATAREISGFRRNLLVNESQMKRG